jgi:glycosyltransferase involved in cell wall biosynthesis
MKILLVSPFAPPERGAVVLRMQSFSDYATKTGDSLTILAPVRNNKSKKNVVRYNGFSELVEKIKKEKPAIIIGTSPPMTHSFVALLAAKFYSIPFILDIRDPWTSAAEKIGLYSKFDPKLWIYKLIERLSYKLSDKIFVVSNSISKSIQKQGANPKKIVLIPNGTMTTIFKPNNAARKKWRKKLGIPVNQTVLLCSGHLKQHDFDGFLEKALSVLKKNNIFLLLLTDLKRESAIIAEITGRMKDEKFSDYQLIDLPPFEIDEVAELFATADIGTSFIPEKLSYMMPVKTFDLWSSGLAVLARGPHGELENVMKELNFDTFAANNEGAVRILGEMSKNMRKIKEHGKRAREVSLKKFDRKFSNQKTWEIIHSLVT